MQNSIETLPIFVTWLIFLVIVIVTSRCACWKKISITFTGILTIITGIVAIGISVIILLESKPSEASTRNTSLWYLDTIGINKITNGVYQVFASHNNPKNTNQWIIAISPCQIQQLFLDRKTKTLSVAPYIGNPIFVRVDHPIYGPNNFNKEIFTGFVEVTGNQKKEITVFRPFSEN